MKKQMPVESEGLGPLGGVIGGGISGVNDQSACLVENFKPTLYELEVLARHYLEEARGIEFGGVFLGCSGSIEIRMHPFACRRLATIEAFLGEESFRNAIASTEEKWEKAFTEADEIEKNLEPCKQCGAQRAYYHYVAHSEGYCDTCDPRN